jgi:hypothetical protein
MTRTTDKPNFSLTGSTKSIQLKVKKRTERADAIITLATFHSRILKFWGTAFSSHAKEKLKMTIFWKLPSYRSSKITYFCLIYICEFPILLFFLGWDFQPLPQPQTLTTPMNGTTRCPTLSYRNDAIQAVFFNFGTTTVTVKCNQCPWNATLLHNRINIGSCWIKFFNQIFKPSSDGFSLLTLFVLASA